MFKLRHQKKERLESKYFLMHSATPISILLKAMMQKVSSRLFLDTRLLPLLRVLEKVSLMLKWAILLSHVIHQNVVSLIASFVKVRKQTFAPELDQHKERVSCQMEPADSPKTE